jgi:DNA-binding MarR family transcriptional regulator
MQSNFIIKILDIEATGKGFVMNLKKDLEVDVLMAARDNGIGTILFRNALAKKFGLNLTESLCLTILGIKGVSNPTELARYVGLSTGSTTTMLDRLEKRNFIRRKPNPDDRRGVIIEFEEDYVKAAQESVAGIQKAHRELIARYSEDELKIIADFLRAFTQNLTEQTAKIEDVRRDSMSADPKAGAIR